MTSHSMFSLDSYVIYRRFYVSSPADGVPRYSMVFGLGIRLL